MTTEYSDLCNEIKIKTTDKLLKELQKKSDERKYPQKDRSDKITCVVCGGKYTRNKKCVHDKSKRHVEKMQEYYKLLVIINVDLLIFK